MFGKIKTIEIEDLCVAVIPSQRGLSSSLKEWIKGSKVFVVESCARQVWLGHISDFQSFPGSHRHLKIGVQGYEYMLRLIDGAESKQKFENHAKSQFRQAWQQHQSGFSKSAQAYQKIVTFLDKDTQFIRDKITSKYVSLKHENIVRDFSGQSKGDKVLIIGDVHNSAMTSTTEGIIKSSESKQKGQKRFITITHPVPKYLKTLERNIKKNKSIRSGIICRSFNEIVQLVGESNIVYVAIPMNKYPKIDNYLVGLLKENQSRVNVVHLFGGFPTLTNAHTSSDVKNYRQKQISSNKKISDLADNVYTLCARLRAQGLSPSYEINRNPRRYLSL